MLDLATVLALAADCAPAVSPRTLAAVAFAESRFDPLAIGVNRGAPLARRPSDRPDAIRIVRTRLARGENLDLGLAQINSANLGRLGLSAEEVLDPCRNLNAAAVVLGEGYGRPEPGDEQAGLRRALSRYNTGHPTRGIANGYVGRVESALRRLFGTTAPVREVAAPAPDRPGPYPSHDLSRPRPAGVIVFGTSGQEAVR